MHTRLSVVLTFAAIAGLSAQDGQVERDPQQPPQPAVFRSGADVIRVDMFATRDGKPVTDLKPDEIELLEDGVRQQIEIFEYVNVAPGSAPAPAPAVAAGEVPSDSRSRVFIVFVDTHTTRLEGERDLRLSLLRFLDELLGPTDLVGLMTPDMPASAVRLGRRATVISDVANDERWLKRASRGHQDDMKEFAWENCYGSPRGPTRRLEEMKARHRARNTIAALEDLVAHVRDLREERKAVLLLSGGWPPDETALLGDNSRTETEACADDRIDLLRTNFGDLLRDLTRSANRANVSFYPVNARRILEPGPNVAGPVRTLIRQRERQRFDVVSNQLRSLAEDTDGLAELKTRNFEGITRRIVQDTSAYYLLGYQTTNLKADGRFRTITVRSTRPGVRVRSRRGYGGEQPRTLIAAAEPKAPLVDPRMTSALTFVERFDTAAPFWWRSSAWEPGSGAAETGGGGAFWFVGELGAQTRSQLLWSAGATADVLVTAADKKEVLASTVALGPSDTTFSVRVPAEGSLAPGDYSIRVRLRPTADDETLLSDSTRVTLEQDAFSLGQALIWRRGPSSRLEFLRTADPRFRRNERLRMELPTTSTASADARLLDRMGKPIALPAGLTERTDPSGSFKWLVIEPPLAALAPGDYAVEVNQGEESQITAFRVIP